MRRQRLQLDSLYVPASGHGFESWLDRFGDAHPEYFALQSDGKRGWNGSSGTAKICESSETVWRQ